MGATRFAGWLAAAALLTGLPFTAVFLAHGAGKEARVVKVTVQRFSFTPDEIRLKTGQPAVLEFHSLDFTHGFKVPDLAIRTDLPPGRVTTVRLTPEKAGVYDFLCDNFCGSGHEGMDGRIVVTD